MSQPTKVGYHTHIAWLLKWDTRYLSLAKEVAKWSKDPSTQVGAVLVSPDRKQIVVGYNGFPSTMEDRPEDYSNREMKYRHVVHGEINAILQAQCDLTKWTLYTVPFPPCADCAKIVAQAGITRVVAPRPTAEQLTRWADSFIAADEVWARNNVSLILVEA